MKKILLISNYVFHYRLKIYNYFYDEFKKNGYNFELLADDIQNVSFDLKFKSNKVSFSVTKYLRFIKDNNPDYVILFLHLKDIVMIPIILYCKIHKIPVIYWNHGINNQTPNAKFKNKIFYAIHNMCDALITYTPKMREYFSEKNQHKLFVAYNTLNLTEINKDEYSDKSIIKDKYGIKEKYVILFASRMMPYKRVDVLINNFKGEKDIAVVMVGPGMSDELLEVINNYSNLYYLGEKYGKDMNEIYSISDIFSTPGHIGLSICDAFFWGLPVILLDCKHAPEIYYMKNEKTGFIVKNEKLLKKKIIDLLNNHNKYKKISDNCLMIYDKELHVKRMFKGFIDAIEFCNKE